MKRSKQYRLRKVALTALLVSQGMGSPAAFADRTVEIRIPDIGDVVLVRSSARAFYEPTPDGKYQRVIEDKTLVKKRLKAVANRLGCESLKLRNESRYRLNEAVSVIVNRGSKAQIVPWEHLSENRKRRLESRVSYAVPYTVEPRFPKSEQFAGWQGVKAVASGLVGLGAAGLTLYLGANEDPSAAVSAIGTGGAFYYPYGLYERGVRSEKETALFIQNMKSNGFAKLDRNWVMDKPIPSTHVRPMHMFATETYCQGSEDHLGTFDWYKRAKRLNGDTFSVIDADDDNNRDDAKINAAGNDDADHDDAKINAAGNDDADHDDAKINAAGNERSHSFVSLQARSESRGRPAGNDLKMNASLPSSASANANGRVSASRPAEFKADFLASPRVRDRAAPREDEDQGAGLGLVPLTRPGSNSPVQYESKRVGSTLSFGSNVPAANNAPKVNNVPAVGNVPAVNNVPAANNEPAVGNAPAVNTVPQGPRNRNVFERLYDRLKSSKKKNKINKVH